MASSAASGDLITLHINKYKYRLSIRTSLKSPFRTLYIYIYCWVPELHLKLAFGLYMYSRKIKSDSDGESTSHGSTCRCREGILVGSRAQLYKE